MGGMNDFMPHDVGGRLIGMLVASFAYWFPIYMMAIVLLHQLPGEKALGAFGVAERLFSAVWPTYLLILAATCYVGAMMGPYMGNDPAGLNEGPTGVYWLWTVVHRQPFGDVFPNTPFGRCVTVPAAMISVMYMPYALALVAVRKLSSSQHESLLEYLRERPEDALGRGYVMPKLSTGSDHDMGPAALPWLHGHTTHPVRLHICNSSAPVARSNNPCMH